MGNPEVIGRYEIIEELGRGAMGSVFKARDPAVGRIVALKTIHSEALNGAQSEEYRARFYREARASGVLAHPGIVPVFDVGEHETAPFLVMEFVQGRTLADAIKKGERFTIDRVCEIGQQLADALGYAHRQGVIHRDIKPANILMTSREVYGSERPRITDFGIAKLAASEITTTGQLLGTPSFMPPEQFTGMPIDGRADLFSLGVILYSLATGEQPFPGETMTAVSYKIVYTEPVPPAKLNPALPLRVESIILKCLAKSPADRYQTGEELAQELAAIRANTPGSTLQPTAPPVHPVGISSSDLTFGPGQVTATLPPAQSIPPASASLPPAAVSVAKKSAQPKKTETIFAVVLLGIAALGAAAAGGWFYIQHHKQVVAEQQPQPIKPVPPPQPVQGSQPETQQQPVTMTGPEAPPQPGASKGAAPPAAKPQLSTPGVSSPSAGQSKGPAPAANPPTKPSAAKLAPAAAPTPATPATGSASSSPGGAKPASGSATPSKASGAFDPRKLDPNKNAKLKIELAKFPNGLPFSVEMNKQPYLHFTTGDGASLDDLFVPPGSQKFRVILKAGGQEWDSTVASGDFKAKKRSTLKIQLTDQGKVQSKITLPISKDAQLSVSISSSLIDNLF
jgi:serine/threonine protein kinase